MIQILQCIVFIFSGEAMKIHECKVKKMHPTQITVGMAEVREKKVILSELKNGKLIEFLREHPIPAVIGPEDKMYLTDHHHLGRALTDLGIENCFFMVDHDLSTIAHEKFYQVMETLELLHPYDEKGIKKDYGDIPRHIEHLIDDPYRSLAGFVRRQGGYVKANKPYTEFLWADFFRPHIDCDLINQDIEKAIQQALELVHVKNASHLPGYISQPYPIKK